MASPTLRIEQIDAGILDVEVENVVHSSMDEAVKSLPVTAARYVEKVGPEIRVALNAVLWSHRVYAGASPGQELMDIAYKEYTPNKVRAHFLLSVGLPYLARRLPDVVDSVALSRVFTKIEAIVEALNVLHYLYFLQRGGYSTVGELILGLRNWNNSLPTMGSINYDTQNRELVWHAFRDVVLMTAPLARFARDKLASRRRHARRLNASDDGVAGTADALECAVCDKPAVIPTLGAKCRHVACYTCAASRATSRCPVCGDDGPMRIVNGRLV